MSEDITGKPLTLEEAQAYWPMVHPAHRAIYEGYQANWLMLAGYPHIVRADGKQASYFYYLSDGTPIAVRLWQSAAQLEYEQLLSKQPFAQRLLF
jgi:hypothetical protein